MNKFHTFSVFCGSNLRKDGKFRNVACSLGKTLAARKINLVYKGGIQGLNGCAVESAITRGRRFLDIQLKNEVSGNTSGFILGTELKVATMHEHMVHMLNHANAVIALPSGLETLEEIFTIIFWAKRNFRQKSLGLLNTNGFYDGILSFLNYAMEQEFIPQDLRNIIVSTSTAKKLLEQMQNHNTSKLGQLMKSMNQHNQNKKGEPDTTLQL